MGKSAEVTSEPSSPLPETIAAAPRLPDRYADERYKLFPTVHFNESTLEEARAIRNKCTHWILPFLCVGYHLMYVDKQTVSSCAPFGLKQYQ